MIKYNAVYLNTFKKDVIIDLVDKLIIHGFELHPHTLTFEAAKTKDYLLLSYDPMTNYVSLTEFNFYDEMYSNTTCACILAGVDSFIECCNSNETFNKLFKNK